MDKTQNLDLNSKYLFEQLITARKEINNLRQQIKSLRYVHERDVNSIKKLVGLCTTGLAAFPEDSQSNDASNTFSRDSEPSTSNGIKNDTITFRPIGTISTWFPNKKGTPRQPVVCGRAPGKITLFKSVLTNPQHALEGLEEFSHMWILFHFHKNEVGHVRAKVAPPRLNGVRTGVFSTRSPHRPCAIGLSLVKIINIQDNIIYFEGVDMVDQTPVLDIKPYIPHYDNPLHIEQILHTTNINEEIRDNDVVESILNNADNWISSNVDKATNNSNNRSQFLSRKMVNYKNSISESQSYVQISSSSSSTSSLTDILRDEELALRLQAEEFQENLNFENVYVNNDNPNVSEENELTTTITNRTDLNPVGYQSANLEIGENNEQNFRNSRFLDGADGPNAVCRTDLDLISRRTLNLRLETSSSSSSPIRMGVREAPDGEEGFDLSQARNIPTSAIANESTSNSSSDFVNRQANESISEEAVRVPDWISRPKTSTLSVVFNERSLQQLHEILNDKADEKKRAVENVLKEDPRSVYLRQRYGNQFYTFLIHDLHITCKFDDDRKIVTVYQVRHASRMCDCGQPEWQCSGHSPLSVFNND